MASLKVTGSRKTSHLVFIIKSSSLSWEPAQVVTDDRFHQFTDGFIAQYVIKPGKLMSGNTVGQKNNRAGYLENAIMATGKIINGRNTYVIDKNFHFRPE